MTLSLVAAFAALQGATEFLPISSSAHLVALSEFFTLPHSLPHLSIVLHGATLLAVVLYFFKDLRRLVVGVSTGVAKERSLFLALVLATLPLAVIGPIVYSALDFFHLVEVVGVVLIVSGVLLFGIDSVLRRCLVHLSVPLWRRGLYVGLFQACAVLPGISRSGICMVAGRLFGFSQREAARFSFLLALPTISGALLLSFLSVPESSGVLLPLAPLLFGALVSFVVALATIHYFLKFVERIGFTPFFVYKVVFGILLLFFV